MRDTRKNAEYWLKASSEVNEEIQYYLEVLLDANESDRIKNRFRTGLFRLYMKRVVISYSSGEEIDVIGAQILECAEAFVEHSLFLEGKFDQLVWFFSIAYILELNTSAIIKMIDIVKESDYNDAIISLLISALVGENLLAAQGAAFAFEKPYGALKTLIDNGSQSSPQLIADYLKNNWYQNSSGAAWHDNHLLVGCAYFGYWSFESAALVKLFDIHRSEISKMEYFPSDLFVVV